MDYEVFLLSRVREDWLATGDAQGSVVRGLAATGRVITSAAAIMVAVFVGFALDPDVTVKMTGRRHGRRGADRRDDRPDGAGAGDDGAARPGQLVAAAPGWTAILPHVEGRTRPATPATGRSAELVNALRKGYRMPRSARTARMSIRLHCESMVACRSGWIIRSGAR